MFLRLNTVVGALALMFAATINTAVHADSGISTVPMRSTVSSEPISLHFERPDLDRIGKLVFMGGLELKSSDSRFGGLSGLLVSKDGRSLLAVSDRGYWVGATLDYKNDRIASVQNLLIAPLLDTDGGDMTMLSKADADAEALTEIPGSGLVVSFEGNHRLWHYGATIGNAMNIKRPLPLPLPVDVVHTVSELPSNGGLESLAALADGTVMAISERGFDDAKETVRGWLFGQYGVQSLTYRVKDSFLPTDLAALPNGDVLVLERRFNLLQGLSSRVRLIKSDAVRAASRGEEKPLEAETVATLAFPYNIDNMEGMAVRQDEKGRTIIYLVSDDNYNPLQRTLLMMFRLEENSEPVPAAPSKGVIIATGQ